VNRKDKFFVIEVFQNFNSDVGRRDGYLAWTRIPIWFPLVLPRCFKAFTLVRREVCPKKITEHTQLTIDAMQMGLAWYYNSAR